jgi:hypothetical protein
MRLASSQMMDLTGLYKVWNPQYKSFSVFGQDHLAKVLLNWDTAVGGHDAGASCALAAMAGDVLLHQQLQSQASMLLTFAMCLVAGRCNVN